MRKVAESKQLDDEKLDPNLTEAQEISCKKLRPRRFEAKNLEGRVMDTIYHYQNRYHTALRG